MLDVIELNSIEQIHDYRTEWRSLLPETPRVSFFHTPEWLESYWRFFAGDQKLRILIVRKNEQLIGVVPLVVRHVKTKLGKIKCLTYPLDDWGTFYGPIGADTKAIMKAACDHIQNSRCDWDIFEPRWVEEEGLAYGKTWEAMKLSEMTTYTSKWMPVPLIELSGTIEEYWATRPSKFRSDQRRNEKRLEKKGELRFVRYRPAGEQQADGDPRWDLYDTCEQIAQSSWQGSSTTGTTLTHDSIREYMRHTHEAAAKSGHLDLSLLYMDDEPIAFIYGYCCQGMIDGLRIGFIRNKKTNGAGRVIISKMITNSFERGDKIYNPGGGSLDWKWRWQTNVVLTYRHTHYSSISPRAQLLRLSRKIKSSFTQSNDQEQQPSNKNSASFETQIKHKESLKSFEDRLQSYV